MVYVFYRYKSDRRHEMTHLKSICAPDNIDFIDYFDVTYVNGTYMKVRVSKFRRNKPLYTPETWKIL